MDDKKVLNSRCCCKKQLTDISNDKVVMIIPCEHLFHCKCLFECNNLICPICNQTFTNILSLRDYKKGIMTRQQFADILSMTIVVPKDQISTTSMINNIPSVVTILHNILTSKGVKKGKEIVEQMFSMNNISIIAKNMSKIQKHNKIFVANHSSYMDIIIMFYLFETGFLASSVVRDNPIFGNLLNIMPCLVIERGKTTNTVDIIRKYIEEFNSICIFPEGMITDQKTLLRFRTGAFNVGVPIYAVNIKYEPVLYDPSMGNFIYKLMSGNNVKITIDVSGPYMPPFSDVDIEKIRYDMAEKGGLLLSRVSNRDTKDK